MAKQELIIIEGKFFRDGKPIETQIGNAEQINAIRNAEERAHELAHGMEVYPDYESIINATISFKCVCGCNVACEWDDVEEGNDSQFVTDNHNQAQCYKCKRKYKFEINDEFDLIVKLK